MRKFCHKFGVYICYSYTKLLIPAKITYKSIKIIQQSYFYYIYILIETKGEEKNGESTKPKMFWEMAN